MNYRALEDLIGILVKKSGYKITDLRVLEDTDYLVSRKNYLTEEIDSINDTSIKEKIVKVINKYSFIDNKEEVKEILNRNTK